MNKVFKVVYSKSKGCYVVVPETAKNNNGKKKVLASVLAGLAVAGAMGGIAPQEAQAGYDTGNSHVNIWADTTPKSNGQNYNVGQNSIVVGYQNTTDNVAGHDGKVAIGAKNTSTNNATTAVGNENVATGGAATAVGAGNTASGNASLAVGNVSNANAKSAVAVGSYNNVNYTKGSWQTTPKQAGEYSTVIGNYSSATGTSASAMGVYTNAAGPGSFAAGYSNNANGQNSVAIGSENTSHVADTITMGQKNNAKTMGGISIGKNNLTDSSVGDPSSINKENSQIAIGRDNVATHLDTIAIGRETKATGSGATVVGARAEASGNNSIAIGQSGEGSPKVIASGVNSIAIGMQSQATGESAIAEGPGSRAGGKYGVALGRTSKANEEATTALGNAAEANIANGVALGSSSVTTTDKGVLGYNPSNPHERKYKNLKGNVQTATTAAVSIGNGEQMTRQLTGLAAGTADTDAVNVAQLKNVGVAVTGNTGKSDFLTDGGKLNVIGEGRVSTVAAHEGAKDSKITVSFDDKDMVKAGKNVTVDEKTVNGRTTYTISAADTAAKYDFLTNAKANGGNLDGTAKPATVASGNTVNYAAGKNLTVKQEINQSIGEQTYTYSLNSDLGGITSITNNGGTTMHFGPDNISITGGNLDLGGNNITNLKSGGDVINNAANIGDVTRISKANEKHIKPGEYAVDNNGKVTMTYLDGNNKDVPNETAVITGIAKQDLSNINKGGETVIQNLAKKSIDMENGKNTKVSNREINGVKTFKVDVEGDLNDITSITNKAGDGKVVFGGNQTVNVAGDHNINLNAKVGDITGLTNVTLDAPDFAKKGRAATEEQLSIVNNGFNNTVGLTGNTGATDLQKLNQAGGLSFGVIGANNGQYIKTTASGSNVAVDLSDEAKGKLNNTVEVRGKNAAKVTSVTENTVDGGKKTIYTVDVDNVTPTAASTEKVKAKADSSSSTDKNIAKVTPQAGDQYGDAGATYEVNVSRNDVKDAAREAVTVNTTNTTNNPITVTPVQDETNHNTTYTVTFDGNKAATQIPLTYKANGQNAQTVTLDKGLNFTNGRNTTASVDAEGVVKYDVNKDLVNINSISNTTNGPKMEFGPNSINITNGPINMGDQNITNLKSGGDVINNAANIGDVKRISKENDLHIAPTTSNRQGETTTSYAYDAASKSVTLKYNDGNGVNQSGTVAKIDLSGLADQIKDGYSFSTDAKGNVVGNHAVTPVANGKTVSYAAGKNLTVAQNIDNATGEHTYTYALSNDVDLTPNGSLKIGDTILNNGGLTITGGPSVTKTGINAGNLNITNVKAGVNDTDAVNVKQLKDARTVVTSNDNSVTVNKTENGNQVTYDLHVAPGAAQSVWNVKSTGNTTADSEATAKTITDGKTVEMAAGKNLTVKQTSNNDGAKVEFGLAGDLTNIKTIKNEGPATFTIGGNEFKFDGGNVNMGDNNITNLKSGGDVINNAANIGDVKRISKANDIHVKDKTYTVNADKTVTLEYVDGNDNTVNKTAKIDLSNLPTGDKAAVESVVKKSAAAGDTNIADITVADGKQTGDANAKYEVNVSRNAVKDAAREAVTVNNANNSNNPITVTPVQDETNHNTTYQVTFDGDKAAKQIPLTYKANGSNDQKVTLDKGLNFTNGSNTTASVAADGIVKYDLNNNVNLTPSGSLTIGDTVVNNGGLTISGGPSVLKTGINAGNLNITNVKAGVNDTDAVNVKQLKDSRTVVTSNDNSVTVNKTENGNQVTYDLHVAPGAAQSVWNVKSSGNTTADSETTAKTITDGKTVEMAAGKNLTVKQTSNNDGAKVEFGLAGDLTNIKTIKNEGPATFTIGGNEFKFDGGNVNMGGNNITNLKSGIVNNNSTDDTNGANIGDVKTISKANDLHIAPTTSNRTGETTTSYAYDTASKSVTLKYNDGNGANQAGTIAKIDLSGLADQIKDGYSFSTDAKGNVVGNHAVTPVANGKTVSYAAGKNLTVAQNIDNATGEHTYTYALSNDVDLTPNGSLKIGDTILNNGGLTITGGPSVTKTGINAGNLNITNVKAGVNDTDAVNVKQLKDARTVVTSNDNSVTINKTENGNQVTYDLHVAPGAAQSVWNVKSTGNTTADSETAAKTISDGKTVEMAAGKNLTVKQTSNNDGAKVEFDLANDIKIGNDGKDGRDGVDGKIGVNGKDGSSVVINGKDGSIGLNGKDGKDGLTMKAKDGQPGVNGKDGITRIVYEDNSKNTHEVATLDDGMKYAGDDAQGADKSKVIAKKLNQTMDIVGGANSTKLTDNNIGVNNVDGKLKVQLAQNINLTPAGSLTIGDTKITDGGLVINNGPSITKGGINAGDLNITNVKAGVNDTDAVNVKQLKSAKTEVKAGDNVTVDKTIGADGQNIYTVNAKATNLGDAELNYTANGGAKQKVKLSEGLNFVDGNYTKASVDANGVVKYDVTLGKVRDGVDGKPGVDGENGIATVKTVVDTINNSGWKGDVTGNTVGDHSATIVKPGTTVNFGAGKNLTVEQIVDAVTGNHTYNYALSDDIKVGNDGKDGKPGVDGKIGVNGKDGSAVVINGKDGSIGLNGKDGKDGLTFKGANGQDGVDGKNGTNGMTRIVYEDSNNNKHEVATTDDGLKFTGNNESVVNKNKLNSTVKVKGEGVTEEQEKTFESAAGNIAVTADGNDTLNIRLNKNIKGIDSIQTKEIHLGTPDNYTTIKKDGDRIKYGDKTFANTDDIWTIQANGTDVPANGGKVNVKGADGITVSKSANGEMTISGTGLGTMNSFNVKSSGNTTADSETTAKRITDGKTVEFSGGKNLTVKQTSDENGAKVEYALSNNVDLTNKGSVTIGDTKITDGGLVINNGPSVTKDGINAGNKQITNVDDGVNDTDAVNVRQLKAAKTNLVDGQNTKVTGDGSKANPYKVNVEGDLNKITSITNNEGDGKLEFKGDQVVNVAGDNTIKLDGKTGDITGLTNKTLDSADFATKGRAATEEQLKLVQQEAAKKSTEKVQAKADANNIAKVAPKAGDTFGAAGATYEVSVDKNDVKDAAREAVTVTGDNKAITVDVQPNATNHTTNYQVNFNGNEAAKQIPLTYKENGGNARTVMLSEGLDFSNGVNTTAHTDANGKVSFDVKGDLTNITSISNNSNGPKVSFGGDTVNITGGNLNMGGNKITNVQKGTNDTDAVNVKQLKDSRTTLTSDDQSVVLKKTESADGGLNYDLSVKGAVDPRVDQLNEEIGRVGAQGAALSALKPMQYDPLEPTQIMAGYGNYRGNSAIAVGVAHYKNESTMFHGGLSWAGGSSHMMANAGVTWKVGNRDAEAAVADRYRKGPISSAYAVQTEMAAMKAQNAGLKGEVSDLKYENEQIKAQNAGLQSEVEVLKAQMAAMMAKMGM